MDVDRHTPTHLLYRKSAKARTRNGNVLSIEFLDRGEAYAPDFSTPLGKPVAKQDQAGRDSLLPYSCVDSRDQGGAALGLHLGSTLSEDHYGQVPRRRQLLKAAAKVLEDLEPSNREVRSFIRVSLAWETGA
jgi:hypothetical protein